MNATLARAHKTTNALHTLLILGAMGIVFLVLGYTVFKWFGAFMVMFMGVSVLWLSPRIAPALIMRLYRARPLGPRDLPQVQRIVAWLARRGGLPSVPELYYVPTQVMNAFTVGDRAHSAIGVTDGLLRALDLRELAGVLAHEVSHVRNNDMRVMTLADMVSRMASTFQTFALFSLVFLFTGMITWTTVIVLMATPIVMTMLQLALSRTREFDADLGALELTGDALGLASALEKMERYQQSFFDRVFIPGRRVPDPSILRSHPNTQERIRRLLELAEAPPVLPEVEPLPLDSGARFTMPQGMTHVGRAPRWHVSGLWF